MNSYIHEEELMHYGIKGMKWGVHKARPTAATSNYRQAKADYKNAKREYGKAYNIADRRRLDAFSLRKSKREANTKRWENVYDKATAAENSRLAYKKARKESNAELKSAKEDFRSERKGVSASRSTGHKIATNLIAGPFANRTYNSVRAAGGSRAQAMGVTIGANMLGGPLGHMAVSAIYTRGHAYSKTGR